MSYYFWTLASTEVLQVSLLYLLIILGFGNIYLYFFSSPFILIFNQWIWRLCIEKCPIQKEEKKEYVW